MNFTVLKQPAEASRTEFRLRGHLKEIAELAEAARVETYLDNPAGVVSAIRKLRSIIDEAGAACNAWQAALKEKGVAEEPGE